MEGLTRESLLKEYRDTIAQAKLEVVKEDIQRSYESVVKNIEKLVNGEMLNLRVADPDYTGPTLIEPVLPFDAPEGALQYFLKIKIALESALKTGKIQAEQMPERAPRYLIDLMER